jgi:hypothetical protein
MRVDTLLRRAVWCVESLLLSLGSVTALSRFTEFSSIESMLIVYTYLQSRPTNTIDLSMVPLNELAQTVRDIVHHQKNVDLWFGYMDGWMLTPHEEVILRKAIRKFTCHVVSLFPCAFSQSWKNEIHSIYTENPYGDSDTHHNGSAIHDGNAIGYGGIGS